MHTTTTIIIGAGQAGLAMSKCLTNRSIDHVLLERGSPAHSWRTERWDSLRLLTPNWMTRLPGHRYEGPDADGYMTASEVIGFLDDYKDRIAAPVHTDTTVHAVRRTASGFEVDTDQGCWNAKTVVVATGECSTPKIPAIAAELPNGIHQLSPIHYRNPDLLPDGQVLVVGASASGAQIADELARSGREVTMAVGEHVRLPRTYRGMDIHWWMDALGLLDERYDEVDDIRRARRLPSLQLVGSPQRRSIGLNELAGSGVRFAGRLAMLRGSTALFSGSFANACTSADLKQRRLLDAIDEHAATTGLDDELEGPTRPAPTSVDSVSELDLRQVSTVVWATGFRPNFPFLAEEMLDAKGAIVHDGGVMAVPGMYVLGQRFQRRRKSNFIDGVGFDALELSEELAAHLDTIATRI